MKSEIIEYLKNIKPTKIGMLLLAGMILIIPIMIDLMLGTANKRMLQNFSFTLFTVRGFVAILLGIVVYHLVFFMISMVFKTIKNKKL